MEKIQFRRDTAANWKKHNPILAEGELGIETDTKLRKVGDGSTAWNNLDYLAAENITQELGNSENAVISQKAVTSINKYSFVDDKPLALQAVESYEANTVIQDGEIVTRDDFSAFKVAIIQANENPLYITCNFSIINKKNPFYFSNLKLVDSNRNTIALKSLIGNKVMYIPIGYTAYVGVHNTETVYIVKSFSDKGELVGKISYANAIIGNYTYDSVAEEVLLSHENCVLSDKGTLVSGFDGFYTSDYIANKAGYYYTVVDVPFNIIGYTYANVCYYTDDESDTFITSFSVMGGKIAIFQGVKVRICSNRATKVRVYPINSPNATDIFSLFEKNSNKENAEFNEVCPYYDFILGEKIEPTAILEKHMITTDGVITSLNDESYKVYKYDTDDLPDVVALAGRYTAGTSVDIFVMAAEENKKKDDTFSITYNSDVTLRQLIKIPQGINFLYVAVRETSVIGLDKIGLFNPKKISDASEDVISLDAMTPIETKQGYYISGEGVLTSLPNNSFYVDIYDISNYVEKYITLNGTTGAAAALTAYAFSDNETSIYTQQTFEGAVSAGSTRTFTFENVKVPIHAKYLYISRYTARGDFNIYPYLNSRTINNTLLLQNQQNKKEEARIYGSDVLICPIYGQSLAVGGEAYPFISNHIKYEGLQVGVDMNDVPTTGSVELPFYGLQEGLITQYCKLKSIPSSKIATKVCSFCQGIGSSSITVFVKGTEQYTKLISKIQDAYDNAIAKGHETIKCPAITYVQGEADILQTHTQEYKSLLSQLQVDLNTDIKNITGQEEDIAIILYQTNQLNLSSSSYPNNYTNSRVTIPTYQYELILENDKFVASTPLYPFSFYNEYIHIDGYSQKMAGYMYGNAILNYIEKRNTKGLIPTDITASGNDVILTYNVPSLPLVIDTDSVMKADDNYGYTVVKSNDTSILQSVELKREKVILHCSESPIGCKVRYGFYGDRDKSGWENGPRGNIRDSAIIHADVDGKDIILHNWAYMFDELIKEDSI